MSRPPRTPTPPPQPADDLASTRSEVLIEAIITDRERRKPGYTRRLLDLLLADPADTPVTVLRPTEGDDETVRQSAINWLRQASVRARAKAGASKRRNP